MMAYMKTNWKYIIDFDSTIIQVEALDELAAISLADAPNREATLARIRDITKAGMEGQISIAESLHQRIGLLNAHRNHIEHLIKLLKKKISPSFKNNKSFLKKKAKDIFVFTSGFKEYVLPIAKELGLKAEQVYANTFEYDKKGNIVGVSSNNHLAHARGKIAQLQALNLDGDICVIGDGYTDYEMKESGLVKEFIAFTESAHRDIVVANADRVARSFDEVLYAHHQPTKVSYPKSKIEVLLLEAVHPLAISAFEREGFSVKTRNDALSEAELISAIKNVSLLGIRSKTKVTPKVLAAAPKLMGIGAFCIGTEQIALDDSAQRGVAVFNAPYSNTRSVVELAIGETIMLMRRVFESSSGLHAGRWTKSASGCFEIRGKKLGIVGYGNIGSQLSVLAEGLGMEVYYYDVVERLALGNARKCRTLDELLGIADVLTLHVDGRSSNRKLMSKAQFEKLKKGCIFLNLSRGHIVDIPALVHAIKSGTVAGAAIDVFPYEPLSNKEEFLSELRGLPNVILTPHIGGSTLEAQRNIGEHVAQRLMEYVNTGSSFGSVNFPNIQLPSFQKAHRLLHIHRNVPGILAQINGILADGKINILGQYLKTNEHIGYVITDVNKQYSEDIVGSLRKVPDTIKFRVLY
jgi:D-3-phosphoglycerate dehydrogenase